VQDAVAFCSLAVGEKGPVVLGHCKRLFQGAVATPKHVFHDSAQAQHPSTTQILPLYLCDVCTDAMICAGKLGVETVANFSSGRGLVVRAIALGQKD
jgi:hypothetical protein